MRSNECVQETLTIDIDANVTITQKNGDICLLDFIGSAVMYHQKLTPGFLQSSS